MLNQVDLVFIPSGVLTFAVPWPKFVRMMNNMKESFLITKPWNKIKSGMKRDNTYF